MKFRFILPLLGLLIISPLSSQNLELISLTIPDSLKKSANAVVRYEHTNIEINSSSHMTIEKEYAVTILNKYGDVEGNLDLGYDDHRTIKDVDFLVYDAFGKEIKKVRKSDYKDVSGTGNSLYTDNRVLYYHHTPLSYPYTIKYRYKISTKNTAFIQRWIPVNYYHVSTELSTYTLTYPSDIKVYFKENNFNNYNIENNSKGNIISYKLKSAKAVRYESLSPDFLEFGPYVGFAINKFHLAGVYGEADNWNEFGKWIYDELLKGRDALDESTKEEVRALTKGVESQVEKARIIYDYMQDKTRYISVQIGVGGWKPMLASDVDKLGYGDCKALTLYTQALLKAVDIESYYTIIYAKRRKNIDKDLASIQGNHAILMIPNKKDTVWLECTSQKVPFGYLGKFTDDRDALVVTPSGGKIIHTKSYQNIDNKQTIIGEYTLDDTGLISVKAKIESMGVQYDDNYLIADYNDIERDTYYKDFFNKISNIEITNIKVKNNDTDTRFLEDIEFTAANYAVLSGKRMLVRLNALNAAKAVPKRYRNRKLPLEIQHGFLDIDEILIHLPQNYEIDALSQSASHETIFGYYKIKIEKITEHQIKYSRELMIKQGKYAVEEYELYRKFKKKINQLDNAKIVLIKI